MMSSDNIEVSSKLETSKDEEINQGSSSRRKTSSTTRPLTEDALKCPRCNSINTKFCYYNNYSLTQPRYFCKTCRRYWTKGGALRSVPIGGGCRKNKKLPSSSSDHIGGFKFLHGFINSRPMDFNLANTSDGFSRTTQNNNNNNNNIAASIESLSCINQELHWKLQQERLGMLLGNNIEGQKNDETSSFLFQNLQEEFSRSDFNNNITNGFGRKLVTNGETATEWFFGNSYAVPTPPVITTTDPTPTNSNSNGHDIENASTWNNGFQAWSVLQQQNCANYLP